MNITTNNKNTGIPFVHISVLIVVMMLGCKSEHTNTGDQLKIFDQYYKAENADKESKWDYISDTLKVWFSEDDPVPDLRYRGEQKDGWDEWDIVMNSKSHYDSIWYNNKINAVQGVFYEDNDFYRLLGASANKTLRTYSFNTSNKITDLRYETITEQNTLSKRHMEPVYRWALVNEPQEIAQIFPQNKLVPSTENAVRWKNLIKKFHLQLENMPEE